MRRLLQLTWKSGKAYWYQAANFNVAQTTKTPLADGWGATFDNATNTIVLSDGSPNLSFVDPATLTLKRSVQARPGLLHLQPCPVGKTAWMLSIDVVLAASVLSGGCPKLSC